MFDVRYLMPGIGALLAYCGLVALVPLADAWVDEPALEHAAVRQTSNPIIWRLVGPENDVVQRLPRGSVTNGHPVVLQELKRFPGAGERLELVLPDGTAITAVVTATVTRPNGDVSWQGFIVGEEAQSRVVFTLGKSNTASAVIHTPTAIYTMNALNGVGWLSSSVADNPGAVPVVLAGAVTSGFN